MIQKLALPSALFLFMLGGCSTLQQPAAAPAPQAVVVVDDAYRASVDQHLNSVDQALSTLDSRDQAAQNLIGELGRKLELLTTELRQTQATVAAQAAQLNHDQAARSGAANALARHLEASDRRFAAIEAQAVSLQASTGEARQQMERLSAQLQLHQANHAMELQAEIADLAERIEDGEAQLEEVISQIVDLDTAMAEKAAEAAARLDALEGAVPKAPAN